MVRTKFACYAHHTYHVYTYMYLGDADVRYIIIGDHKEGVDTHTIMRTEAGCARQGYRVFSLIGFPVGIQSGGFGTSKDK